MIAQWLVVALLVTGCFVYAAWALLPATARRRIAAFALEWPLPASAAAFMRRHATASAGCACNGCDQGAAANAPKAATQTIRFHPRVRR
jgi:hypothetical protein